ncbi:MAG: GreA/GreB family elongation factor [Burkholderiaceae bacterium]
MTDAAFGRTLTDLDHIRLYKLLQRQGAAADSPLAELIDAAEIVTPQTVAPDVVTMLTRVRVAAPAGGAERSLTLCYPPEADAAQGFISVLSPLGTALLGLRVGQTARWHGADGRETALTVRAIELQPEANGDYTD